MATDIDERRSPQLVLGSVLLAVGIALLLDRLGIVRFGDIGRLWPLFIIVPGGLSLLFRGAHGAGLPVITVGILFLISAYGGPRVRDTWPAIVIAAGVQLVWSSFAAGPPACTLKRHGA